VFDFASGTHNFTIEADGEVNGNVISLAFNPRDPAMLAAAFEDGSLLVWKDWNGDSHHPIKLRGTNGIAYQIGFTNNGELLMGTSDDGMARIWRASSLWDQEPWQLRGHSGPIYAAAFSSDGKYLVTGSTDKSAIVWNKRPALHEEDPLLADSSPKDGAINAVSGCGIDFRSVGCIETPGNHVFPHRERLNSLTKATS
jgi:WD40 repeat protein